MKQNKRNIYRNIPLLFGTALILGGCSMVNESLPGCDGDSEGPGESYRLRMSIFTQGAQTRTGSIHEFEDGTTSENYIALSEGDYKVVVYDSKGNYLKELDSEEFYISGADGFYSVETPMVFSDASLSDEDASLLEALKSREKLQILVLANWKSFGTDHTYPVLKSATDVVGKSLSDLTGDAKNYNFTYSAGSGSSSWIPSADSKDYIPMFGMAEVSEYHKGVAGVTYAVFKSVPMMRALSKIVVKDLIKNNGGASVISEISLSKYNEKGRFIPDLDANKNWNINNTQIEHPSLPSDYTETPLLEPKTDLKFFETKGVDGVSVFTAYVPEMKLTGEVKSEERPHLDIKIKASETSTDTKDYRIEFWEYKGNALYEESTDEDFEHLLRNHIYSYDVKAVSPAELELTLNVLPWDGAEEEIWYYEELPGNLNPIEWTYGQRDQNVTKNEDKSTVTLNLSTERDKILKGKFTIDQPLSGTWHAYLMTVGAAIPDAVCFCERDGSDLIVNENTRNGYKVHALSHISGAISADKIKADPIEIYIKCSTTEPQQESSFKLLVQVENLGNWMEAKLTGQNTENMNWIIVRPTNLYEMGGGSGSSSNPGQEGI